MAWKEYSPIIIRYGISAVFLWFGINQLLNPTNFMGYLPDFLLSLEYAKTLIILNGALDLLIGLLLAAGLFTRLVAFIAGLHLLSITISLGYNDIAVRDFGLMLVTFGIAIGGPDKWCLDKKYWR